MFLKTFEDKVGLSLNLACRRLRYSYHLWPLIYISLDRMLHYLGRETLRKRPGGIDSGLRLPRL
jgi:hypothetical protein